MAVVLFATWNPVDSAWRLGVQALAAGAVAVQRRQPGGQAAQAAHDRPGAPWLGHRSAVDALRRQVQATSALGGSSTGTRQPAAGAVDTANCQRPVDRLKTGLAKRAGSG